MASGTPGSVTTRSTLYRSLPYRGYPAKLGVVGENGDLASDGHDVPVALHLGHIVGRKPVVGMDSRVPMKSLSARKFLSASSVRDPSIEL